MFNLLQADKKGFDQNDLAKVVAYVGEGSKEHKELYNAALNFAPMLPFYVVHDVKLAKMLHLKKLNSLQLAKPYEKVVSYTKKGEYAYVFVDNKMKLLVGKCWELTGFGGLF